MRSDRRASERGTCHLPTWPIHSRRLPHKHRHARPHASTSRSQLFQKPNHAPA